MGAPSGQINKVLEPSQILVDPFTVMFAAGAVFTTIVTVSVTKQTPSFAVTT